jgi:nitroreductase
MTLSAMEVNRLKQAPAIDGVLPAVLNRWSPRAFSDRDVSSRDLKAIFEAVRWAASSNNEQPWRYLVGTRGSATHQTIFSTLVGFNKEWAGHASVLLLGLASNRFVHRGTANCFALHDLGAADATLALQATSLGLSTHFMGGYNQADARAAFGIPEDYTMGAVIALGYQGEPSAMGNEKLIEIEIEPRTRKALSEFVFSAWAEPAELG